MKQQTNRNRRWVLASRPHGAPQMDNFRLEEDDVATPGEGQVLLRTVFLSLDPYMRGRMSDEPSYAPPVEPGCVMVGGTVSRVVASNHPDYRPDEWVLSYNGWQDYDISDGEGLVKLGDNPQHPSWSLGILGMPGFTAYMGLLDIGQPKEGETLVVAAATGPVGATVGQIGKLKGCRVVGNAVHVFATGETQAYYNDFADAPEKHLARALAEGFAYQGEISPQTGEPRGVKSTGQPPVAFVDFIQNHDQVGNRAQGDRLITLAGAERTKVLLATLLLSPHIPLLFMGEEYGESRPFLFFTDFHGDLARAVREGRAKEFADHAGENVPDPNAPETFQRSKLNWKQQHSEEGKAWLAFTRELLLLRQKHIVPLLSAARESSGTVLQTAPGFIAVSWRFPGGTLSLALNISATTVLLPDLPGKTLFAWPNESTGSLSQHSLIVRLAQGESAS